MNSSSELGRLAVLDTELAYRSAGAAHLPTAVFLHGNPTSSFVWRKILPLVAPRARCLAPDLVGFGASGKPSIGYRFADHARYLESFLDAAGVASAYFVAQDWGTALAFDLLARRSNLVRGIAFMEFIAPMQDWSQFHQSEGARDLFRRLRTPGVGESLVLEQNVFIERILPGGVVRRLSEEEMHAYRGPFLDPHTRSPMLSLPRELPIAHEPADVDARLRIAHAALRESEMPKLLFVGDPGALLSPQAAEVLASELPHCRLVRLPSGLHYLQEDHPERIGMELAAWIESAEKHS